MPQLFQDSSSSDRQVFSIGQLNSLAKDMLETLSVWVEAEVSEFKGAHGRYYYLYFTLKDTGGDFSLPAVVIRQNYPYIGAELVNGQKILAFGKLSLFTKSGSYQFVVNKIEAVGAGALAAQLEKLKLQLQKEGLLDQDKKRQLPNFPQRIGVVTSIVSDAWADFQRHTIDKFPLIELTVADTYVQGPQAPASILKALKSLQQRDIEAIVITRGGGSAEDLAAFNDEAVVRAIAGSPIPTLVAVGHEKDISIADLVADVRASTPTNAGQIITRNYEDAQLELHHLKQKIANLYRYQTSSYYQQLDHLLGSLSQVQHSYRSLPVRLDHLHQQLASSGQRLSLHNQSRLDQLRQSLQAVNQIPRMVAVKLSALDKQLQSVSPHNVLARGYSMVTHQGQVVCNVHQLATGDTINIQLYQGKITSRIEQLHDDPQT